MLTAAGSNGLPEKVGDGCRSKEKCVGREHV